MSHSFLFTARGTAVGAGSASATALQAQGHEVFTPTLTGRGGPLPSPLTRGQSGNPHSGHGESDPLGGTDGPRAVRPLVRRLCHQRRRRPDAGAHPLAGVSGCLRSRRRRQPAAAPARDAGPRILERREERWGRLEGAADSCGSIQRQRCRPRVGGSAMHDATDCNDAAAPRLTGGIQKIENVTFILATGWKRVRRFRRSTRRPRRKGGRPELCPAATMSCWIFQKNSRHCS